MRVKLALTVALLLLCFRNAISSPAQESASDELSQRVNAALEARKSEDPRAIAQANHQVIVFALIRMAKLRLDAKEYDEAVKLCRESLEFEDSAQTRVEMAIASLYAKKYKEAVEQAAAAADLDPGNALAWTIKGEALLRNAGYDGAVVALEHAIDLKRDAEPLYSLGMAYLGKGEKQKASEAFSEVLALTGDGGWSRVLIGRAYGEGKFFEEAVNEFKIALRLDPGTPNAHYYWAYARLKANDWSPTAEVQAQLREELRLNPRHFLANYVLGISESIERKFADSDRHLRVALELRPDLPETWMYLGLNANAREDKASAERYFRRAITLREKKHNPKEHLSIRRAYIALGRILLSSGKRAEGERLLETAREMQVEDLADRQEKVATIRSKEGTGVAGAIAPEVPEADSQNSISFSQRNSQQRDSGSAALKKTEVKMRAVLGAAFNDLATAEALQEKYDLALRHYLTASAWDPHIPGLNRNVGLAYFATGDFAKAARVLTPFGPHAAQDPQLGFALAKSLAETGNKAEAMNTLQRVESAEPALDAERFADVGKLWQKLDQPERARRAFRRALEIDPKNAEANCGLHLPACSSTAQ